MTNIHRTAVVTGATSDRGIGMTAAQPLRPRGLGRRRPRPRRREVGEGRRRDRQQVRRPRLRPRRSTSPPRNRSPPRTTRLPQKSTPATCRPVGALANIAGITSPVPFLETTLELWNKVMAVNATGTYLVTKAFLPAMIDNGWGRIVNMSSVSAQRGGGVFGKVPYSSAKAAILGFTKALAREIADTGVTVNAVTPGAVDTNIRVGSTDEQEARPRRRHPDRPHRDHRGDRRGDHILVERGRQLSDRHHHRHQRRQPHPLDGSAP